MTGLSSDRAGLARVFSPSGGTCDGADVTRVAKMDVLRQL